MSVDAKGRVVKRVTQSGALPVSRDSPGYAAVLGVLGLDGDDTWEGDALRGEGPGAKEPSRAGKDGRSDFSQEIWYRRGMG